MDRHLEAAGMVVVEGRSSAAPGLVGAVWKRKGSSGQVQHRHGEHGLLAEDPEQRGRGTAGRLRYAAGGVTNGVIGGLDYGASGRARTSRGHWEPAGRGTGKGRRDARVGGGAVGRKWKLGTSQWGTGNGWMGKPGPPTTDQRRKGDQRSRMEGPPRRRCRTRWTGTTWDDLGPC